MPSRQLLPVSISPPATLTVTTPLTPVLQNPEAIHYHHHHHHRSRHSHLILPLVGGAIALSILILMAVLYRKLSRRRTAPADLKPPHRFSYSALRRATSSFSASNRLGQGGFGSVYRGILPSGQEIAVKLMDSGSLQGEREFQNELSLAGKIDSDLIISLLGFCSDRKRRRLLLVYELMHNRSLQDALLHRKCAELMEWKKRFAIAIDIARGIEFLHIACNPPIIHGDIKPSNILLDCCFSAKIADFGLAHVKTEDSCQVTVEEVEIDAENIDNGSKGKKKKKKEELEIEINGGCAGEDNGSVIAETESVTTAFEDVNGGADMSPENFLRVPDVEVSPETVMAEASPSENLDKTSVSEGNIDKLSVDSGKDLVNGGNQKNDRKKSISGKDWWWRQDNGGGSESGSVKDYVMEWIGNEIKKDKPKSDWITASDSTDDIRENVKEQKKPKRHLKWWQSLDEEKKEKGRRPREWWREEFCEELTRKKKKKRGLKSNNGEENWWQRDEDSLPDLKKKMKKNKTRTRSSLSSMDWWLDGLSERRNSHDWLSGEIPKSGGVSSTPSMRGTVCYIAPEYGGGGNLSEKCDVYSFGVLLLVLVSGRRPLQVTASPMSEFERANLISWARNLAYAGKLLDLVDPDIHSLDQEQALLLITIALICLQRSPARRPTMKEIVGFLSGELEPPHLPFEFSPSPPSGFPFKSRKKLR